MSSVVEPVLPILVCVQAGVYHGATGAAGGGARKCVCELDASGALCEGVDVGCPDARLVVAAQVGAQVVGN